MKKLSRRKWLGVVTAAIVAAVGAVFAARGQADDEEEELVLAFSTMRGNLKHVDINNNIGAGLPWVIRDGDGVLTADGEVRVRVRGLVFGPNLGNISGTNPVPSFRAIVSCTTVDPTTGATEIVNISTGGFPADKNGNCNIHDTVTLPNPCYAPIILVGPETTPATAPDTVIPGGTWFAATGF